VAFNIVDMLRGDIVQRQQPQQNSSAGLGEMLSYLMQSTNQPVARLSDQGQSWSPASLSELAQVSANRRQEKQQEDSFAKLQELIGTKGTPGNNIPTPFRGAVLPTKGTGLRGGGSLEDFAIGLAGVPDKVLAAQGFDMITNLSKPTPQPALHSMGVPNKPGYKVNFYLDANNQPVPVGEPYKADGGININTGAAGAMGNILTPEQNKAIGIPEKDVAQVDSSGKISIIKPAPAPVELKDWQRKNLDFATRMIEADEVLSKIGTNYDPAYVKAARYVENTPILSDIANAAISENDQRVLQAQRQLLNSVLRPESGAVIGDVEFASGVKQYFPQPSDSKEVLIQKANARKTAIEGLLLGIPPEFLPKTDYSTKMEAERRTTPDGRVLIKYSDGSIEEAK
jgi:hypothetical protein